MKIMSYAETLRRLRECGYVVGKRDPSVNYFWAGRWMVHHPGLSTPCGDGTEGGEFAVVGNDLRALLRCAQWQVANYI